MSFLGNYFFRDIFPEMSFSENYFFVEFSLRMSFYDEEDLFSEGVIHSSFFQGGLCSLFMYTKNVLSIAGRVRVACTMFENFQNQVSFRSFTSKIYIFFIFNIF